MKYIFKILILVSLFVVGQPALAQFSLEESDKSKLVSRLDLLVQAVNFGDISSISNLVSPDNQPLQLEIKDKIRGGVTYKIDYTPFDESYEILDQGKVKISARFSASGAGWNVSGLSNYFVFEKRGDDWLITDTDFHRKLGAKYVFDFLWPIIIIVMVLSIPAFIFFIFMLIDCIKRDFEDKTIWIVLLIFLQFIAAIFYYFMVKKKNVTSKPLQFKL